MFRKFKAIFVILVLFSLGVYKLINHLEQYGFGQFYLLTPGNQTNLIIKSKGELLKGDMVIGKFLSPNPNLGTVSVRFNNRNRDSNDSLIFRLKEEDTDNWIYQAKYNTDQFKPGELFPFGFPVIKNSDDRSYIFELESEHGSTGSGIYLDQRGPLFASVYFFDKQELMQNRSSLLEFILKKIVNIFGNQTDLFFEIVFFSPFIFYLIYLFSKQVSYQFLPGVILLVVAFDLSVLNISNDLYLISSGVLWLLAVFRFKFSSQISSFVSLGFLLITIPIEVMNLGHLSEKTATWSFLFLTLTIIQKIYELRNPKQKQMSPSSFIQNIGKFSTNSTLAVKAFRIGIILTVSYLCLSIFLKVEHGLLLFKEYFPEKSVDIQAIYYLISVFFVLSFGIVLFIRQKKLFFDFKILMVIYALTVFQIISTLTSNITSFEHTPKIFSISPNVTEEAWVDVTLKGKNFQDRPFVGKVYIDGVEQGEYVVMWTNEEVVVRTNPSITKSGSMCIQTLSKGTSNCVPFHYGFGVENRLK